MYNTYPQHPPQAAVKPCILQLSHRTVQPTCSKHPPEGKRHSPVLGQFSWPTVPILYHKHQTCRESALQIYRDVTQMSVIIRLVAQILREMQVRLYCKANSKTKAELLKTKTKIKKDIGVRQNQPSLNIIIKKVFQICLFE